MSWRRRAKAFANCVPICSFQLGAANSKFSKSVDALQEDAAKQPRVSAEFLEFHATHCDGSQATLPLSIHSRLKLIAKAPLHVRRVSLDVLSFAIKGRKENVLNMRPPRNKYVHRINMRVPAGVSVQPEFKKSRLHAARIRFPTHEIEMGCAWEPYSEPFMRSWPGNRPHEFVTDTFCGCQPFC